jgi:pimeloyl-ACP methyl ester carboxylesterase
MVPEVAEVDGLTIQYAVSDNEYVPFNGQAPQVWAVNLHGYFAGGGMYWRESARLAGTLGWRVVNPSLPGFAGSDPLPWNQLSMSGFSDVVAKLLDHLGAGPVVVLGHSMGGAVATQFAYDHPERTLGLVYRDGAATTSWKERRSILAKVLSPISPDLGAMVDLVGGVALDVPDLLVGRIRSTLRGVMPDARLNLRSVADALPVAAMLFASDLTPHVEHIARDHRVPLLPVWGKYDRITPVHTAEEFARVSGREVHYVRGGHSWMIARPGTQQALLRHSERGRAFMAEVRERMLPDGVTALPHRHTPIGTGLAASAPTDTAAGIV